MSHTRLSKRGMAHRVAQDIGDGTCVNLGIGLPTLVSDAVPADREVVYHSENGVLGVGPAPETHHRNPDLINAGKDPISLVPGGSYVHHTDSFMMIRGGHIDITVLGAFQVSCRGDLANWATDHVDLPPAVGGAMDLAVGAKQVLVMTKHTTRDGLLKILERCTYPLTAAGVVNRIYTDLAVIDVTEDGLVVSEIVTGLSRDGLQAMTGAPLQFAEAVHTLEDRAEK